MFNELQLGRAGQSAVNERKLPLIFLFVNERKLPLIFLFVNEWKQNVHMINFILLLYYNITG